jgi:ABC-type glutathione transport system ATPase component
MAQTKDSQVSEQQIGGKSWVNKAQTRDSQVSEQQIGGKSWVPQQDDELRRVTTQSLIHEVSMAQFSETASFVPWFLSSMPVSYFRQIDGKTQRQHMATIMTLRQLNDQTGIAFKTDRKSQAGQIENSTYIVRDPKVFLFDEPLSNLDAKLRVAMRAEIKALHQRLKTTTVYVTHDQIEAMTMADRIVVMHDGIVEQDRKSVV